MKSVSSKPVILYAEDDLDDFDALKGALAQLSDKYELKWAKNGEEVVNYLNDSENVYPSLVVLDLNMPIMDGKQTLLWLKSHSDHQDIPVMVFTTSSREEDVKLCQSHKCTFFRKPTLYRDLLHIVQTMMQMCEQAVVRR
ncbi:MAG TPA: response regulator [Verrucomicrobiae bacterium]|nr:response regulator [Verrucomicrobiae bacterium]